MLAVRQLDVAYGQIQVLYGIDIAVQEGEIVAVLGPNGAGKSTLMKAVMGVHRQRAGTISFDERGVDDLPTAQRIRLGMGIIPEGRQLFLPMTVRENLLLGAYAQPRQIDATLDEVFALFPRLRERQHQEAASLSGGEAQMVAVARALMSQPRLLLCDEPSLGLAPMLVRELLATLVRLRERGITILLADQNAHATLAIADRGYILDSGRVVAIGRSDELRNDRQLHAAYLGGGMASAAT